MAAESFISAFCSSAGQALFELFRGKLVLYCSVVSEVQRLRTLREHMKISLAKTDELQATDKDEKSRDWMLQMRYAVDEIEEMVDVFDAEEILRQERSFIQRLAFIPKRLAHFVKLGERIQLIKSMTGGFDTDKEKFAQGGASSSSSQGPKRQVLHNIKEDFVMVGLEAAKATLIGELLKEDDTRGLIVVSIVGTPGSGKTTLAKHIYLCREMKSYFDCCAWADVSKEFTVNSVLLRLLKDVGVSLSREEEQKIEEGELMDRLNNSFENKRYLVVLDDLWSQQAWDEFSGAFPNGKLGRKVLLTSRNHKVGTYADPRSQPVVPEKLSKEEGWVLFCKKAFNDDPSNCPEELKDYGKKMVEKCSCLPLAIVVLGGLLSTKHRSVYEWAKVLRNINWNLGNEERLKTIIAKTYEELSYQWKSCFIYMSLFHEDHRIRTRRLIGLWIAEGFICKEGEETFYDAVENWLWGS